MYFKPTTWNSADRSTSMSLSNNNLTVLSEASSGYTGVRSVSGVSSGKWYWELTYDTISIGNYTQSHCVATADADFSLFPGQDPNSYSYSAASGYKHCGESVDVTYGSNYFPGDIIGVALDMDNGKIWFSKNGVWQASGNPETGINPACVGLSGTFYAMLSEYSYNGQSTANFGASPFSYTVPIGFITGLGEFIEEMTGRYTGNVYYHNTSLEFHTNYIVKLILNGDNFNFDLAQSNGFDFRLAERSNGSGIFKMWVACWDKDNKYAVLWFKIPYISADLKSTFYAFWGGVYSDDTSIPEELGFLFYENFKALLLFNKVNTAAMVHQCYNTLNGACCHVSDNIIFNYWQSYNYASNWNKVDLGVANEQSISGVRLQGLSGHPTRMINSFKVFGSNNDSDWDELYSGNAEQNTSSQCFMFDEVTDAYRYYRCNIYSNHGDSLLCVTIIHYIDSNYISKWGGTVDGSFTLHGCLFPSDASFTTLDNPLNGKNNWIVEAGVYLAVDTSCDLSDRAHGFEFIGDENGFIINMMHNTRVEHNAVYPSGTTYQNIDQTYGGLEQGSYQEHYIAYYEPEDRIYQRISNRKSYADIENKIDRKVEGDTRINNVRLHGRQTDSTNDGAYPSYISWFVIREYDVLGSTNLDGGELYIQYENVDHQTLDYKEYTEDLTSIDYFHVSSFGGDVSKLSNNNISDVWYSDEDAVLQDQIYATIYFDRAETLVSDGKFHYDSSHETFYGASKMSDSDSDVHGRDHWRSEALNAWAIINFYNDRPTVNVFGIKAVSDDLNSCPKNYKFYGGLEPYHSSFKLLHEGTFTKTTECQSVTFVNKNPYKYYKFEVIDSYGNDIKVQEWSMYEYIGSDKPKYISQVRLLPDCFGGLEDNFPKEISLEGSNDMLNWETVMPWTNTYTPYISHNVLYGKWQRYSFTNIKGYRHYRLACKGNWGATDGRIVVGEWEMCELKEEENIHRILSGDTNTIKQIWASDTCGFEDAHGLIYIANEKLNIVQGSKFVEEKEISEFYDDINVI